MAPEKVTKMVMDVDLNCSDCYKKVKKIIGKIPEIRDQEYDIEKNKVKISVVCCCPEKIRDKLCNKGGSSIQKIEVVVDKPKEPTGKPKPKEPEKPKSKHKEPEKPKVDDKPKEAAPKSDPSPKSEVAKMMVEAVHGYPQMYPQTYAMIGYGYEGYGGPRGYGMHVAPPQPSGYGYGYGYEYNQGYNGNAPHYTINDYFSEENPQGCSIMPIRAQGEDEIKHVK